jgi:hypothetical protein
MVNVLGEEGGLMINWCRKHRKSTDKAKCSGECNLCEYLGVIGKSVADAWQEKIRKNKRLVDVNIFINAEKKMKKLAFAKNC